MTETNVRASAMLEEWRTINFLLNNQRFDWAANAIASLAEFANVSVEPLPRYESVVYPSQMEAYKEWCYRNKHKLSRVWSDKMGEIGKGHKRLKIDISGLKKQNTPKRPEAVKGEFKIES